MLFAIEILSLYTNNNNNNSHNTCTVCTRRGEIVGMAVVSAIVLLYETKIYLKVYMLQPTNTLIHIYTQIYIHKYI